MNEDNKLRSIGIDPDGDPVEIMLELDRRMEAQRKAWEKEDAEKPD